MTGKATLFALAVAAIVCAVFAPSLAGALLDYDDLDYTLQNDIVAHGLTATAIARAFTEPSVDFWHPLTMLSHAAAISLFGSDARGHHAINVALHATTAALLVLLLASLRVRLEAAAAGALLFALHPLRVESVAWVAERKDALSGVFFVVTLLAYVKYARSERRGFLWLALLAFLATCMSKPLVATPGALLLLDLWPLRRARTPALIVEKIPFFAVALFFVVVTVIAQMRPHGKIQVLDLPARLGNALVTPLLYLEKLALPIDLANPYPWPADGWSSAAVVSSTLALLVITAACAALWQRAPQWLIGWLWFVGMQLPTSGIASFGNCPRADRFTYVPMMGLALALAVSLATLSSLRARVAASLAVVALCFWWSLLTIQQIGTWRTSDALFRHAIDVDAGNQNARWHLAYRLLARGEIGAAHDVLAFIPRAERNSGVARLDGDISWAAGDAPAAIDSYVDALTSNANDCEAHEGLARALLAAGNPSAAASESAKGCAQRSP